MLSSLFSLHANLLKAIANPKRLEIINLLRDGELTVRQIQDMLDLSQGNLSQHLMVLRQERVVKTRKEGKQIYYKIANQNFIKACDLMREVLLRRYKNDTLSKYLVKDIKELVPLRDDPVCGMRLSPKTASFIEIFSGKKYYFCASGCLKKFKQNPGKYL